MTNNLSRDIPNCTHCGKKEIHARGMCKTCYNKISQREFLYVRLNKPLTKEQIEHNTKAIYKRLRRKRSFGHLFAT